MTDSTESIIAFHIDNAPSLHTSLKDETTLQSIELDEILREAALEENQETISFSTKQVKKAGRRLRKREAMAY